MTNSEALEEFSRVTGISDPKVEQIVRQQESWVYNKYSDMADSATCAAIDEGNGDAFNSVTWGTWPSWEEDVKKRTEQSAKDYNHWKPHKKQEEFHKSKKRYRAYVSDKGYWDRIDKMTNDLHDKFCKEFNKFVWPNGRGAVFGDDEIRDDKEYYNAEWREVKKPLALPAHEEEKKEDV